MKRFLLCCLWVIFDIPASAQTDSTVQKDTSAMEQVQNAGAKKLIPFNSYLFTNANVPFSTSKFSMVSSHRPVTYQVYERTPLQTFMEVTGMVLSLVVNPRNQPYIPLPNHR